MYRLLAIFLAFATMLAACVPTMYGVPQESWDRMSETERVAAIRAYEREQQARLQAAEERRLAQEERARHEAMERERERARQAAIEREKHERIEAIHRGEGAYGELIRVRLQGGKIKIGGQHHRYEPLTFTIADGETRKIAVADKTGREVDLVVTYASGAFAVEGVRFPYDRDWKRGILYADTSTGGLLELRGVDLFIAVHDRSARFERERLRMTVHREELPVIVPREKPSLPPRVEIRHLEPTKTPPTVNVSVKEPVRHHAPPASPPTSPAAEQLPKMVEVLLLDGEQDQRRHRQKRERKAIRIAEGESRELEVQTDVEKRSVLLHYRNGELLIEVTPGNKRDAIRFSFEKEWRKGRVYKVSLPGKVPQQKVEFKITAIEKK